MVGLNGRPGMAAFGDLVRRDRSRCCFGQRRRHSTTVHPCHSHSHSHQLWHSAYRCIEGCRCSLQHGLQQCRGRKANGHMLAAQIAGASSGGAMSSAAAKLASGWMDCHSTTCCQSCAAYRGRYSGRCGGRSRTGLVQLSARGSVGSRMAGVSLTRAGVAE